MARRRELLQAASAVFKRKGLQAASINDVAAELGSDRASVYYYYASKEEIFHDLVGQVIEELVVATEAIAASDAAASEKLAQLLELVFDSFEANYPYQYIYIQEDMTRIQRQESASSARLLDLADRYEAVIAGIIRDGIASGDLRDDVDPQLLTLAVLGAANWSHRWYKPGGRLPAAAIGRSFAEFFLHGVRADATTAP